MSENGLITDVSLLLVKDALKLDYISEDDL